MSIHATTSDALRAVGHRAVDGQRGATYDNGMMESAWSSLKRELVYETISRRERRRDKLFSNGSFGTIVNDFTAP